MGSEKAGESSSWATYRRDINGTWTIYVPGYEDPWRELAVATDSMERVISMSCERLNAAHEAAVERAREEERNKWELLIEEAMGICPTCDDLGHVPSFNGEICSMCKFLRAAIRRRSEVK